MNEQISKIQTREVLELMRNLAPILNQKELFEFMLFSNRVLKRYMPEYYNDGLSEEVTEMRKDKAWLKEELMGLKFKISEIGKVRLGEVFELVDQLDEPTKPVIPQFVAVWIEETKKQGKSLVFAITHIYYKNEIGKSPNKEEKKIFQWMELAYNEEVFARAWIDGYEVEKEKLYHVVNKENYFMLRKYDGLVELHTSPSMSRDKHGKDTRFMLTEKEIKDYDERYIPFMVPVDEVNND